MKIPGNKVQNIPVLFLFLIVVFSCKNVSTNKKPADIGTSVNDTASVVGESDNYILDETSSQDNGPVYMYCEKMPEFPGGEKAFYDYMKTSIVYPVAAVSDKKEGRVVLKFIITEKGQKSNIKIIRSIRPDIDNECINAINAMPAWEPGLINGKPVSVSFNITIRFLLENTGNLNGIFILPSKKSI